MRVGVVMVVVGAPAGWCWPGPSLPGLPDCGVADCLFTFFIPSTHTLACRAEAAKAQKRIDAATAAADESLEAAVQGFAALLDTSSDAPLEDPDEALFEALQQRPSAAQQRRAAALLQQAALAEAEAGEDS